MTGTTGVVQELRTTAQILAEYRRVVVPALRDAVSGLPAPIRLAADHHFGWLDGQGRVTDASGGKMIRPALVLLAAEAVGGSVDDAMSAAVAVELVHNFSLLHDDLMDADHLRHHRPTVWMEFGVPTAVLAGDALWALALRVIGECGHPAAGEAMRVLAEALDGLVRGQSADMDFEHREYVGLAECLEMVAGKTAALLGGACALGALLGGGSRYQVDGLARFGQRVGIAFQFADDLLGIWGRQEDTGKPARSDLVNRKKSLPVVYALSSGTAAAAELAVLYRLDRPLTPTELEHAANLVERAGGKAWAQRRANRLVTEALTSLHSTDPLPAPAARLAGLAGLVACRDR